MANGDVRSLSDAAEVRAATGVDGVMCARGMLENPAMFAGESKFLVVTHRILVSVLSPRDKFGLGLGLG